MVIIFVARRFERTWLHDYLINVFKEMEWVKTLGSQMTLHLN